MIEIIAILVLAAMCVVQAIDKYLFTQKMLVQLGDAVKASMSRNLNEYMVAVNKQEKTQTLPVETDEVLLTDASDEEFEKHITQH